MPGGPAYLLGGPCNGTVRVIDYQHEPPIELKCKGETYHHYPDSRGGLVYVTADWTGHSDHAERVRGQRDVLAAWDRLMRVAGKTLPGEVRRINGARHRIRRAVR